MFVQAVEMFERAGSLNGGKGVPERLAVTDGCDDESAALCQTPRVAGSGRPRTRGLYELAAALVKGT